MAPKRKQRTKSTGNVTRAVSTKPSSVKEEQAMARALKRAERVEAKRVEAEKRKEAGNVHFRAGEYYEAVEEYEAAIEIQGPNAPHLSNLAAAWLKLEDYDNAELCAQRALVLDPKFIKARYRRGLARKGNFEFARAVVDFQTILKQDPGSTEAKDALRETLALMCERDDDDYSADSDDEGPLLDDIKVELESVSDSSDWNHEGNGIPCTFYNHDGCTRGNDCRFSHASDHKSVRDRLGRNVCMYFLFGNCKFGSSKCVYAHDKAYLPPGRWWEDEGKRLILRHVMSSLHPDESPAFMPYMCGLIDDRLAWASAHGVEMEDVFGHSRAQSLQTFRELVDHGLAVGRIGKGRGGPSGSGRGGERAQAAQRYHDYIKNEMTTATINFGPDGRPSGPGGGRNIGRGGGQILHFNNEEEWDSWVEERMDVGNYGFTEDEEMELLAQGVKPWDDDARDVLDALYSL